MGWAFRGNSRRQNDIVVDTKIVVYYKYRPQIGKSSQRPELVSSAGLGYFGRKET
jgi:hypothetical protein